MPTRNSDLLKIIFLKFEKNLLISLFLGVELDKV